MVLSSANRHDSLLLEATLNAVPPVRNERAGRPRHRPVRLHADRGYDLERCREALQRRGVIPRIARRGMESSERLGRWQWVVERTLAWLSGFRRLAIRFERRADSHLAFTLLACAILCWRRLEGRY